MIQELTYIVYTINQSKHTKVKAGRDGKWHNPCELITWLEAIAECQVKNSQDNI
jgi:transketolase